MRGSEWPGRVRGSEWLGRTRGAPDLAAPEPMSCEPEHTRHKEQQENIQAMELRRVGVHALVKQKQKEHEIS